MWYLVVPPIVVVLSLFFLLWYLSKKGSEPAIAEKVRKDENHQEKISFPRTKEFFLKMLEKFGQRFKVASLRAHNTLHDFTQSVRASRARVHTGLMAGKTPHDAGREEVSDEQQTITPVVSQVVSPDLGETSLESPILRRSKSSAFTLSSSPSSPSLQASLKEEKKEEKKEEAPRPMVSEMATHPEKKKRVRPNALREENLISRIARDPKDFTAYEELGDYYLEMENIKDAKECYRQGLKLSPVHRMVKIKIRRLEKLLTRAGE